MGEADKLFTDGQAYERLMGRWSRIAAETFRHWLDAPKISNGWMLDAATALLPRS